MEGLEKNISADEALANIIGEAIRCAREKRGQTQQKLADELGCERARLSDWERGVRAPDNAYRRLISQELGIDID